MGICTDWGSMVEVWALGVVVYSTSGANKAQLPLPSRGLFILFQQPVRTLDLPEALMHPPFLLANTIICKMSHWVPP